MTPLRTRTLTRARIEIIPLIDVIFFLLATFVLFTLSLNKIAGIELTLPRSTIQPPDIPPALILSVTAHGGLFWDGAPIESRELTARLEHYRSTQIRPRILIAGDIHASYGAAVHVLDAVRAAGIDEVSIETRVRPSGR